MADAFETKDESSSSNDFGGGLVKSICAGCKICVGALVGLTILAIIALACWVFWPIISHTP